MRSEHCKTKFSTSVTHLYVLIFLLLLFFAALALLLCLLQPFDKRSSLGVDLFGKFLRDVLLRNLVDRNSQSGLKRLRLNTVTNLFSDKSALSNISCPRLYRKFINNVTISNTVIKEQFIKLHLKESSRHIIKLASVARGLL